MKIRSSRSNWQQGWLFLRSFFLAYRWPSSSCVFTWSVLCFSVAVLYLPWSLFFHNRDFPLIAHAACLPVLIWEWKHVEWVGQPTGDTYPNLHLGGFGWAVLFVRPSIAISLGLSLWAAQFSVEYFLEDKGWLLTVGLHPAGLQRLRLLSFKTEERAQSRQQRHQL